MFFLEKGVPLWCPFFVGVLSRFYSYKTGGTGQLLIVANPSTTSLRGTKQSLHMLINYDRSYSSNDL
jgi:hypothetical protein